MVEDAQIRVGSGKAAEAVVMKQIGPATVSLIGSNSRNGFKSFVGDAAIVEEVDECRQENLPMIEDRFGASDFRKTWKIGNPTVEDFGIDRLFKEGDQKRWFITCDHCGKRQSLDWFTNVVREVREGVFESRSPDGYGVVCSKCSKPLDRLGPGEWIAMYPGRTTSSYTVSKLHSGTVPMREIGKRFETGLSDLGAQQVFYNADLGLPFTPKGAKLTEEVLKRCVREFPRQSTGENTAAGVDVGTLLHTTVIDKDGQVIAIESFRTFEELAVLMDAYGATVVIDGRPEARKAREFADKYPGRVWICDQYKTVAKAENWKLDNDHRTVSIDRTASMDGSHAKLLRQAVTFPRDAESIEDQTGSTFFSQMMAPTRVWDATRGVHIWTKGVDHWRHAYNLATVAREIRQRFGASFAISVGKALQI